MQAFYASSFIWCHHTVFVDCRLCAFGQLGELPTVFWGMCRSNLPKTFFCKDLSVYMGMQICACSALCWCSNFVFRLESPPCLRVAAAVQRNLVMNGRVAKHFFYMHRVMFLRTTYDDIAYHTFNMPVVVCLFVCLFFSITGLFFKWDSVRPACCMLS